MHDFDPFDHYAKMQLLRVFAWLYVIVVIGWIVKGMFF